jgi:chromosome segregation ATPase
VFGSELSRQSKKITGSGMTDTKKDAADPKNPSPGPLGDTMSTMAETPIATSGLTQDKAQWAASSFDNIASAPGFKPIGEATKEELMKPLTHDSLEADLTMKALAQLPHRPMQVPEVLIREITSAAVHEIVGIFETLIDRLLIEKKQSVIKDMVAQLVTEDIKDVIAGGREGLKRQELGLLTEGHRKIREDMRAAETAWQKRFLVTQELKENLAELTAEMDTHFHSTDGRLAAVEKDVVPRTEVEIRLNAVVNDLQGVHQRMASLTESITETKQQIADLKNESTEKFATKLHLKDAETRLDGSLTNAKNEMDNGLKALRDHCAAKADVATTFQEHQKKIDSCDAGVAAAKTQIADVSTDLFEARRYAEETYATKVDTEKKLNALKEEMHQTHVELRVDLQDIQDKKATKKSLDDAVGAINETLNKTRDTLKTTTEGLERTTDNLTKLANHCDASLAKKEQLDDLGGKLEKGMKDIETAKADIEGVSLEVETERDRLRKCFRQQQHSRVDLNQAIDQMQELKAMKEDFDRHRGITEERVALLDVREAEHWEETQAVALQLKQAVADLEVNHSQLHDGFQTHVSAQQKESDKLKDYSTKRYLEQMDRALALHTSVKSIRSEAQETKRVMKEIQSGGGVTVNLELLDPQAEAAKATAIGDDQ